MKALTVQQPWAWAIFNGKTIENRTQAWTYRGPLAIHAGNRESERGMSDRRIRYQTSLNGIIGPLHLGVILGTVELVDGQPFPWHIAEAGATFRKTAGGAYLVSVSMFPIASTNNEPLRVVIDMDGLLAFEHVNGDRTVFPWLITKVDIVGRPHELLTIALTFIADHVDADIVDIPEEEQPAK